MLTFGRVLIALVIIGAALALGAYWIGPGVVPRAELELLALDVESRFAAEARLPAADPAAARSGLQPLILAVANTGARESAVESIALSVPGWIRLHTEDGPVEPAEDAVSEPLRRYVFMLGGEPVEPGTLPRVPAGLDRLWVSAEVPSITCRLRWDGVPELAPSPPWNAERLRQVSVFFSIEGERDRHTGVLRLDLEPGGSGVSPASFSAGDPVVRRPGDAPPSTDSLTLHGEHSVTCGAPSRRVELGVSVWKSGAEGRGRIVIVRHGGEPRRILFDADGDGRIERETWDGDADGLFEAARSSSFPVPEWLMPADTAAAATPSADTAVVVPAMPDSAPVDSAGVAPDTAGAVRPDTTAVDTVSLRTAERR